MAWGKFLRIIPHVLEFSKSFNQSAVIIIPLTAALILVIASSYEFFKPVSQTITTTTSSINKIKFIPHRLSIEDVCDLTKKYFDHLPEDELEELFEKFNSEKIDGKALQKAGTITMYSNDIKKRLGLTEERDLECFDKMVDFVRQQQEVLDKNLAVRSEENTAGCSTDSEETTKNSPHVGVKLRADQFSTANFGAIHVDWKGPDRKGDCGLDYKGTGYSDLNTKDIFVKFDITNSEAVKDQQDESSKIQKTWFQFYKLFNNVISYMFINPSN